MKQVWKRVFSTPFTYNEASFRDTFLVNQPVEFNAQLLPLERIIYSFWTGDNEMSGARKESVESLRQNSGVDFRLITKDNLDNYIHEESPLHEGFQYLSAVHKSDYLRCYFMHHYGGGYSDVKPCSKSWKSSFDYLEKNPAYWLLSYREVAKRGVAQVANKNLLKILNNYWHLLAGNCAYICRANTPFTLNWYTELNSRMDDYLPELKINPGNIMGDNEGYPIKWTAILGEIYHPLCLKYNNRLLFSNKIKPGLRRYR